MKKIILICICSFFPLASQADQLFGDFKRLEDNKERGFSISSDIGMLGLTGRTLSAQSPGFQMAFNLGVDVLPYASIELINIIGINEASPFDILDGGVNSYFHLLAAKLQYPMDRWYPFALIGGGFFHSNPDFNFEDKTFFRDIMIGAGIEYYTFLRHYSFYARGQYHFIEGPINAWTLSLGIKYTF